MWRKPEQDKSVPDDSSLAGSEAQRPSSTLATPSTQPPTLNQHIKIKGEISGQGDFLLDGELEGKVSIPNGTFTVGPNARVTAEIEARQIVIRGEVVGSLKAHERIQILSTAKITGDMDARGISIEDGAELHSKVATPRSAAGSAPAAHTVPAPEAQNTADDRPVTAIRPEPPQRAKGAAAAASPAQSEPEKL